jgi:YfiH family protein
VTDPQSVLFKIQPGLTMLTNNGFRVGLGLEREEIKAFEMQRRTNGEVEWLTFDVFEEFPHLVHGVFLRHGGVSQGEFGSLNFSSSRGDCQKNVDENRKRALKALHIDRWCDLDQEHGKKIIPANHPLNERGDALITNRPHLGLMVLHADCQAALFYDPIENAIALTHCGWRGNVQNIYRETIQSMKHFYGSQPQNILVGISPSLGPQASEFIHYQQELPLHFYPFQYKPTYFDLWAISKWQLDACGILPHHIEIAEMCTYSNPQDFFSYRRAHESGRHATLASLKV